MLEANERENILHAVTILEIRVKEHERKISDYKSAIVFLRNITEEKMPNIELTRSETEFRAAILAERERCAQIAEQLNGWGNKATQDSGLADHIALIIRNQKKWE